MAHLWKFNSSQGMDALVGKRLAVDQESRLLYCECLDGQRRRLVVVTVIVNEILKF